MAAVNQPLASSSTATKTSLNLSRSERKSTESERRENDGKRNTTTRRTMTIAMTITKKRRRSKNSLSISQSSPLNVSNVLCQLMCRGVPSPGSGHISLCQRGNNLSQEASCTASTPATEGCTSCLTTQAEIDLGQGRKSTERQYKTVW